MLAWQYARGLHFKRAQVLPLGKGRRALEELVMKCKMNGVIGAVIFLFAVLLLRSEGHSKEKNPVGKLTGYIEVAGDSGIQRITLPAGRTLEIFKKRADYLVNDFDLLPDAKERVVTVRGSGYDATRLCIYSSSNELSTLLSKRFLGKPSYSPDGKHIAYLSCPYNRECKVLSHDDCYLFVIKADGSSDSKILDLPLMPFKPSWLPDGKGLTVTTRNFEIYAIDIDNGKGKKLIDFGIAPAVSHDGNQIAYLSNDVDEATRKKIIDDYNISEKEYIKIITEKGDRQKEMAELDRYFYRHAIYIYDVKTGQTRRLMGPEWIEEAPVWSPDDKYLAYTDNRYLGEEIYVVDINTGEKIRLEGKYGRVKVWGN